MGYGNGLGSGYHEGAMMMGYDLGYMIELMHKGFGVDIKTGSSRHPCMSPALFLFRTCMWSPLHRSYR